MLDACHSCGSRNPLKKPSLRALIPQAAAISPPTTEKSKLATEIDTGCDKLICEHRFEIRRICAIYGMNSKLYGFFLENPAGVL